MSSRVAVLTVAELGLRMAVENAWGFIECASREAREGRIAWLDLGDDRDDLQAEVDLLEKLGLLFRHPKRLEWVRPVPGADEGAAIGRAILAPAQAVRGSGK